MSIINEIYNEISVCGGITYKGTSLLVNNVAFASPADRLYLIKSIPINGGFTRGLWDFLFRTATFRTDAKITREQALQWITEQSCISRFQITELLDSLQFITEVEPTYLLNGDNILINA